MGRHTHPGLEEVVDVHEGPPQGLGGRGPQRALADPPDRPHRTLMGGHKRAFGRDSVFVQGRRKVDGEKSNALV